MESSVFLFPPWNGDLRALAPSHGSTDFASAEKGPGLLEAVAGRSLCCLHLVLCATVG